MKKTLLILGAGASKDFCAIFPTGLELIKEINYHFLTEKKFPKAPDIYLSALMNFITKILKANPKLLNEIKNQLWKVQLDYEWNYIRNWPNIPPISIDNFISKAIKSGELKPEAREIIKCSIYYLIKGTEQAFSDGNYSPKESWVGDLAEKVSQFNADEAIENLTIATFNYDRIFEKHFCGLLEGSKFFDDKISSEFQHKNVIHIYGSLGNLKEVSFELANNKFDIIKTRHEDIKLIDEREGAPFDVPDASKYKKVHFIGFGYDIQNLSLLNLQQFTSASFYGTAHKHPKEKIKCLKTNYKIEAINKTCRKYIKALIF